MDTAVLTAVLTTDSSAIDAAFYTTYNAALHAAKYCALHSTDGPTVTFADAITH
jgi:hypothetical protein